MNRSNGRGYFKQVDQTILTRHHGATFSFITNELITVAPQLENLKLICADTEDRKDLGYLSPLQSMQQFTRLERLLIPQGASIDTTGNSGASNSPNPLIVLPPTLEYLCVSDPTPAIIAWLAGILDDRARLPNFSEVELDFGHSPTDVLSASFQHVGLVGRALHEAGVVVYTKPNGSGR